ncbi:hypothetical protein [Grimontia sp. NTOU-MAR1]|uniref:hypothetical protein n=1 Tax=Grimontia sp. NTOU-MAR1 TaxID=3111011 RepID=UPI002DBE1D8E|nr:hypothetical protein [Grimontia sp. NTOU-MAR1]WRV98878.1 hypothetical protein VP504_05495 [Grimontia sp. NTOU-MAR1]
MSYEDKEQQIDVLIALLSSGQPLAESVTVWMIGVLADMKNERGLRIAVDNERVYL